MKNRIIYVLSILFLQVCTSSIDLNANTSQITRRVIHYDSQLDWYDKCDEYFTRYTGFKKRGPYQKPSSNIRIINGLGDTIFLNKQFNGDYQRDIYWSNFEGLQMELLDETDLNRYKIYRPKENLWSIYKETSEGDYWIGYKYNTDKSLFYKIGKDENYEEDNFMLKVFFFFMFLVSICLIFPYWNHFLIVFFIGVVSALCAVFFVERTTLLQLTLTLLLIISTSFLFKIPQYRGIIRNISQLILGAFIISFLVYKQFFSLNEKINLVDGTNLDIHWQRGTCLVKRYYIRNMLQRMVPITICPENFDGEQYVVYVSKFEVSEGDFAMVNDEIFSWLHAFRNRPLYGFSYRESRLFLDVLSKVAGVKFDFLSLPEWFYASKGKIHMPNNCDYTDVDEGSLNQDGLLNLTGNVPEYTSTYYGLSFRSSLDADTLVPSYNYVFVAGSAYECRDSLSVSLVNKNFREGLVGFRIIYRPNGIASRNFKIVGHLRSDREDLKLPKSVELISIDELNINDIDDYETFEEKVIESRFKEKTIKFKDLDNNDTISYFHPKGIECYDFKPIFTFINP